MPGLVNISEQAQHCYVSHNCWNESVTANVLYNRTQLHNLHRTANNCASYNKTNNGIYNYGCTM